MDTETKKKLISEIASDDWLIMDAILRKELVRELWNRGSVILPDYLVGRLINVWWADYVRRN